MSIAGMNCVSVCSERLPFSNFKVPIGTATLINNRSWKWSWRQDRECEASFVDRHSRRPVLVYPVPVLHQQHHKQTTAPNHHVGSHVACGNGTGEDRIDTAISYLGQFGGLQSRQRLHGTHGGTRSTSRLVIGRPQSLHCRT